MRFLLLGLMLLATSANGQVVGWADCSHTKPNEDLVSVRVVLMNGKVEKWKGEILLPKTKAPGVVVELKPDTPTTVNYTATGLMIECLFNMVGDTELESITNSTQLRWRSAHHLKIAPGVNPKLGVGINEVSPGLWRAYIGKAP